MKIEFDRLQTHFNGLKTSYRKEVNRPVNIKLKGHWTIF